MSLSVFKKPNFLFIGPDKSGSTYIYYLLKNHPECYVPLCKDLYFFDRYYHKGLNWYFSFFRKVPEKTKAIGELSHDYLFSEIAAKRIAQDLPTVRLLTCLRNPIDRTFSQYLYMIRSGMTRLSFEDALGKFPQLINNSLYAKHLSKYFMCFDRSGIKVLFFDTLESDPKAFGYEICEFLGVCWDDDILHDNRVLPASKTRSFVLARIMKSGANFTRSIGFTNLVGVVKRSVIRKLLYKTYRLEELPTITDETRAQLMQTFLPDLKKLEDMLGVELSCWVNK